MDDFLAKTSRAFTRNRLNPQPVASSLSLGGIHREIIIYTLPDNAKPAMVKAIAAVLMLHGRSTSLEIDQWQTWTLTFLCVCFPQFSDLFKTAHMVEYKLTSIPESFLKGVIDMARTVVSDPDTSVKAPTLAELPTTLQLMTKDFYECGTEDGRYCYFALVVHLMGKQTRTVMTEQRPEKLMETFSNKDIAYVMTGNGRMSDHAHLAVHNAWSSMDHPRKVFIQHFCKYRGKTDRSVRMVFLMFGMLEYSGMQSAVFINSFLNACPWVISDVPLLAPAFSFYRESVIAFSKAEAEFRPYIKLYHGNSSQIFHSKSLQNLNAVAVMWLSATVPSMKDYQIPGGETAKTAFAKAAKARNLHFDTLAVEPTVQASYIKLYHGNSSQILHSKSLQDLNAAAVMWFSATVPSMKDYRTPGGETAKTRTGESSKSSQPPL